MVDENSRESVLTSIKLMLGIPEEVDAFDNILIIHINSCFSILTQLGVGPKGGFSIISKDQTWQDFVKDDKLISQYKSYMYLKVRSLFDPPQTGPLIEASNKLIAEFEWRLCVESDDAGVKVEGDENSVN